MRSGLLEDRTGQATLEYALVSVGFLALLAGIAALWRFAGAGGFSGLAVGAASHGMAQGALGLLKDVVCF